METVITFADMQLLQVGRRCGISKPLQRLSCDILTANNVEILQFTAIFRHQSKSSVVETGVFEVWMFYFGTIYDHLSDAGVADIPKKFVNV